VLYPNLYAVSFWCGQEVNPSFVGGYNPRNAGLFEFSLGRHHCLRRQERLSAEFCFDWTLGVWQLKPQTLVVSPNYHVSFPSDLPIGYERGVGFYPINLSDWINVPPGPFLVVSSNDPTEGQILKVVLVVTPLFELGEIIKHAASLLS